MHGKNDRANALGFPATITYAQLIDMQHAAYRDTTSERRADEFASQLLAADQALVVTLTVEPGIMQDAKTLLSGL